MNIDNKMNMLIDILSEKKESKVITQFDIFCIKEMTKNIYKQIELIKKYDIDYYKLKQIFYANSNELTIDQKKAINEFINCK